MRQLVLILAFACACAYGRKADPDKPVYQSVVPGAPVGCGRVFGGLYCEVENAATDETLAEARRRVRIANLEKDYDRTDKQLRIAWYTKLGAMALFLIGGYIHLKSIGGVSKSAGSTMMGMAVLAYVFGVLLNVEAEHSRIVEMAVMAIMIGLACWRLYVWRNEDGTKPKRKPRAEAKARKG